MNGDLGPLTDRELLIRIHDHVLLAEKSLAEHAVRISSLEKWSDRLKGGWATVTAIFAGAEFFLHKK